MKTMKSILLAVGILLAGYSALALDPLPFQTVTTDTNSPAAFFDNAFSSISLIPYGTYHPNPGLVNGKQQTKVGGGLLLVGRLNDYSGVGVGVDYLGGLQLISANITFKLPTRPLSFVGLTNFVATPWVVGGVGKPYSSAGPSSGDATTFLGTGANFGVAKLAGGTVSLGAGAFMLSGAGPYNGLDYRANASWSIKLGK